MSVQQASYFCPQCQQQRLFTAQLMNHTPHILASVFLCGLWLPVWALIAINYNIYFHCSQCGFSDSPKYLANPRLRQQQAQRKAMEEPSEFSKWLSVNNNGWKVAGIAATVVLFFLAGSFIISYFQPVVTHVEQQIVVHKTPQQISNIDILLGVKNRIKNSKGKMRDTDYYYVYLQLNKIPQNSPEYQEAQKILQQYKKQIDSAKQTVK